MLKFTLTIACDNEAFADDPYAEVARILELSAKQVATNLYRALHDSNGNRVGKFEFTDE